MNIVGLSSTFLIARWELGCNVEQRRRFRSLRELPPNLEQRRRRVGSHPCLGITSQYRPTKTSLGNYLTISTNEDVSSQSSSTFEVEPLRRVCAGSSPASGYHPPSRFSLALCALAPLSLIFGFEPQGNARHTRWFPGATCKEPRWDLGQSGDFSI